MTDREIYLERATEHFNDVVFDAAHKEGRARTMDFLARDAETRREVAQVAMLRENIEMLQHIADGLYNLTRAMEAEIVRSGT